MNYSTAVMLVNDKIKAVRVQYDPEATAKGDAVFKTTDQNLKIDDMVVVESGTRHKMTTAKITAVNVDVDFDSSAQVGWVISKVDTSAHEAIKEMESKAIDMIKTGELKKRRETIMQNTLDAVSAAEIGKLDIAKIGQAQIADAKKE